MIHISPKCTISELMDIVSKMEWGDVICVSRYKQANRICRRVDYETDFIYADTRDPLTRKTRWLFLRARKQSEQSVA